MVKGVEASACVVGQTSREATRPQATRVVVPFWIPLIIRHRIFWGTQKGTIILTTTEKSDLHLQDRSPEFGRRVLATPEALKA